MNSYLLKMTSVLSVAAFMAVTLFTTPAQAEIVDANDVLVEASADYATIEKDKEYEIITPECWVWRCTISE